MVKLLTVVLCCIVSVSLPSDVTGQASTSSGDLPGVLKTIGAFRTSLEGGDARAFADLFALEADFTNIVDQSVHGRDSIYYHHVKVFKNRPPTRTVRVLSHTVRFLKPDVAAVEIRWENKHKRAPDGSKLPDRDGVWVSIMTRESGQWYFTVVRNVMLNDGSAPSASK
jgi:uncharacterized protein (TIGR02246 family)